MFILTSNFKYESPKRDLEVDWHGPMTDKGVPHCHYKSTLTMAGNDGLLYEIPQEAAEEVAKGSGNDENFYGIRILRQMWKENEVDVLRMFWRFQWSLASLFIFSSKLL